MSTYMPIEVDLLKQIFASAACADLDVSASLGLHFGVVLIQRGTPVGIWSAEGEGLCLKNRAGTTLAKAANINEAIESTAACLRGR